MMLNYPAADLLLTAPPMHRPLPVTVQRLVSLLLLVQAPRAPKKAGKVVGADEKDASFVTLPSSQRIQRYDLVLLIFYLFVIHL